MPIALERRELGGGPLAPLAPVALGLAGVLPPRAASHHGVPPGYGAFAGASPSACASQVCSVIGSLLRTLDTESSAYRASLSVFPVPRAWECQLGDIWMSRSSHIMDGSQNEGFHAWIATERSFIISVSMCHAWLFLPNQPAQGQGEWRKWRKPPSLSI
jgi:hypothetical protein